MKDLTIEEMKHELEQSICGVSAEYLPKGQFEIVSNREVNGMVYHLDIVDALIVIGVAESKHMPLSLNEVWGIQRRVKKAFALYGSDDIDLYVTRTTAKVLNGEEI